MSEQSRYSRFLSPVKELSPQLLERAIRPDPGRELQLVAVDASSAPEQIVGGARYSAGPGSKDCEFAVAVTDAWQGLGIARHLLEALIRTSCWFHARKVPASGWSGAISATVPRTTRCWPTTGPTLRRRQPRDVSARSCSW